MVMRAEDGVIVVGYDPDWPARFRELTGPMRAALGDIARRIDHIGSTAVPGLAAKPVIDIQISVASFEPLDAFRLPLEALGYIFRAENPELTKRYFREPPGAGRVHIHVRLLGHWNEQFALLFRDYLRTHPETAGRYGILKRDLAARYSRPHERQLYTEAKDPFIWESMYAANRWAQDTGWRAGPSDA
jgi:GrpB-like predicted nucleotidyltransferase (UPF0157 family)